MKKRLLILAGDGIGPEVMNEVKKIITWLIKTNQLNLKLQKN